MGTLPLYKRCCKLFKKKEKFEKSFWENVTREYWGLGQNLFFFSFCDFSYFVIFCFILQTVQRVPQRYIAAIMNFAALLSVSTMSSCLSLTITQMVTSIKINETLSTGMLSENDWAETSCPMPLAERHLNGTMEHKMVSKF